MVLEISARQLKMGYFWGQYTIYTRLELGFSVLLHYWTGKWKRPIEEVEQPKRRENLRDNVLQNVFYKKDGDVILIKW